MFFIKALELAAETDDVEGEWPLLWKPEPGRNGGVGGMACGVIESYGGRGSESLCVDRLFRWRFAACAAAPSAFSSRIEMEGSEHLDWSSAGGDSGG